MMFLILPLVAILLVSFLFDIILLALFAVHPIFVPMLLDLNWGAFFMIGAVIVFLSNKPGSPGDQEF
jgi:hypothetical protein